MKISEYSPVDLVFGCQDTTGLLLEQVDIEVVRILRLVNKAFRRAIDRWIIRRLVLDLDEIRGDSMTGRIRDLSTRFLSVDHLVIRHATISREIEVVIREWCSSHATMQGCNTLKRLEIDNSQLESWDNDGQDRIPLEGVERMELYGCRCASVDIVSSLSYMLGPSLQYIRVEDIEFCDSKVCMPLFTETKDVHIRTVAFVDTIQQLQAEQSPLFLTPSCLSFYQERLENLDLSGNALGLDNIRLLFHEGRFSRLQRLRLRRCSLHESHAEMLSCSSSVGALCHLDLAENQLGTQTSMFYISSSVQLTRQLQYLNISKQSCCQPDCMYGWFLTMNPWESLITLKMNYTSLNAAGMHGLLQSRMYSIRHISLRESYLTSDALAMLGRSNLFATLVETLDLSGRVQGVEVRRATQALAFSKSQRLQKLILRSSGLTSARAKSADRKALKELITFHGPSVEIQLR